MSAGYYTGSTIISKTQMDYILGLSKNGFTFATAINDNPEYTPKILIQYELSLI